MVYTDLFKNFNSTAFQEIPGLYPENVADAVVCVLGTPSHVQVTMLKALRVCYSKMVVF